MSQIRIKESQLRLLEDIVSDNRLERIDDEKAELENYIEKRGEYMTDITNGKTYLVQYLEALSKLVARNTVCVLLLRKTEHMVHSTSSLMNPLTRKLQTLMFQVKT